ERGRQPYRGDPEVGERKVARAAVSTETGEQGLRHELEDDEQDDADPERYPERLRREPRCLVVSACAAGTGADGGRAGREEVEDREGAGEDGRGEAEGGDLGPTEVTDDRRVDQDVQRLGRERAEGRQRQADDLAVVRGTETHRAADDNAPMPSPDSPLRELNQFVRLPSSRLVRVFLGLVVLAALAGLFWWRRGSLETIGSAFSSVRWEWVVVAIVLNLLSVVVRALAWNTVIHSAMEPPHPGFMLVFSAFSVGLFANALLPGRVGELARVAV